MVSIDQDRVEGFQGELFVSWCRGESQILEELALTSQAAGGSIGRIILCLLRDSRDGAGWWRDGGEDGGEGGEDGGEISLKLTLSLSAR